METIHTQLLVLGAGPGGYSAAFRAADLGLSVVIVERYPTLGGVCLNVGCIPSKTLLHIAQVIDDAKALNSMGVNFNPPQIDLNQVQSTKNAVITKLNKGLANLARQRKVQTIFGVGRFRDPNCLEVHGTNSVAINFEKAIIATGSQTIHLPGIPDDPRIIDSTAALALTEIPPRLLIIGGGIIGLEMANIYAAFGSQVTIIELTPGLIPGCDPDLVRILHRHLANRITIHLNTRLIRIDPQPENLIAHLSGPTGNLILHGDRMLIAVGRRPNSANLALEDIGIALDQRGFITVDSEQRTTIPHIYAIGDVAGNPLLAHKAAYQGKCVAETVAGHKPAVADIIPSVAYTDPEIAWVGLSETTAQQQAITFAKGQFPWMASGRALSLGRAAGMTKLLFDPASNRLLGAGIVGPGAGELIAEAALAIQLGATARDISRTIHPHPSLSETIALAAEAFQGTITELYFPKKG